MLKNRTSKQHRVVEDTTLSKSLYFLSPLHQSRQESQLHSKNCYNYSRKENSSLTIFDIFVEVLKEFGEPGTVVQNKGCLSKLPGCFT